MTTIQIDDLILSLPEVGLFGLACLTLLLGSLFRHTTAGGVCTVRAYWLSQLSLAATLFLILSGLGLSATAPATAFNGSYVHNLSTSLMKLIVCLIAIMVFLYSREYFRKHGLIRGEYYILGLFSVLGMLIMVSAFHLLVLYLGLELMSLSLYTMVAMQKRRPLATEAAVKYFVLGAIASGILLYGISILYGVTGSLHLPDIAAAISAAGSDTRPWLLFAAVFIVAGVAFKLGAAPFHLWLPDVYQGAPTAVTLFIASAPKLAAFAITLRLLADGLLPLAQDWQQMIMILAVLSIVLGNTVAIMQSNLKRMLAYSAIAHSGFILLGLSCGSAEGFSAALFYAVIYVIMSAGIFGTMILLAGEGQEELAEIDDCRGLAVRRPCFALVLLCLLFSMVGIPPLAGFWAKWFVLKEVLAQGHVWLAVVAVLFSVVGAFYYLRVIKLMYFETPETESRLSAAREGPLVMQWTLAANGLVILLLGLFPNALLQLCVRAMQS